MSEQNSNEIQAIEQSSGGSGAVEEIVETLSDTDGSFVVEEKKTLNRSTIVTFVVLVIGAAGVWFMYQRTGPKSAAAAASNSKETVDAKKTINSFLSGGEASIKLMESMLRNTQKVVEQFLSYPSMTQVPLSDLQTNPFRVKPLTPTAGPDYESMDRRRREEERVAALKAVQSLQLQSIMYSGSRKGCMINGGLYVEGQQVESFIIEQIHPTYVVVRSGVYRFELSMQR